MAVIEAIQDWLSNVTLPSVMAFIAVYFPLLIIPILIALFDFITIVRSKFKKTIPENDKYAIDDFTILIPIFGDISYLKNIKFLEPYGEQVVICTTTKETKKFYNDLSKITKKYHFRIFKSEVVLSSMKHKPNPWGLFHKTLSNRNLESSIITDLARDEIIRDSFISVNTKYCIFLDGDTISKDSLYYLAGTFKTSNLDIASVRILASKEATLSEKLQAIEYELAMDARRIYPWLTSGAAMIAKTKVIDHIMSNHSLFFSGGDIEIGKLSRLLGYKVGHIPAVFYTDVPETLKAWFKQRIAWCGGGFRHAVINMHSFTWRHPMFFLYVTVIVYLLTPFRWYEAIIHPQIILLVIVLYWILLFIFHWKKRSWVFFIFPLYALVQVMIIIPLGILRYFKMAYTSRNIGLIKVRRRKIAHGRIRTTIMVRDINIVK